jgi:protein-disulfide isomerase
MRHSPARHRIALLVALLGAALSAVTLVVHERLAAGSGYTSFCNLGDVVNCDAVLGSRYGVMLGMPVAAWGLAAFLLGAAAALPGALASGTGGLADLVLLGLASGSLGFALVLAVAMALLRHLCLLCLGLDIVVAAWFLAVAPLASGFQADMRSGWWRGRAAARSIAAAGLVIAVAGGTWAAVRAPGAVTTPAEVRARDPKFYDWYTKLPVRPTSGLVTPDCPRKGEPGARVAIVEFSDFQCPFCVQAFRDLRDLVRARPEVSLVFRHYPLDATCNAHVQRSLHPDACLAACAAECARRQGRFWEYHDVLFENNEHLERESLFRYAREMALDLGAFRTCLDDPATRARIGEDVEAGTLAGVSSTPTIFFNGRAIEGALEHGVYYDYALILEKHAGHEHHGEGAS